MTLDELKKRTAVSVGEFAALTGVSEWTAYESIKRHTFPLPTLKVGRRVVIPAAPLRVALGIETPADR